MTICLSKEFIKQLIGVLKMENREEMIDRLVEHRIDCFDFRDLADLFTGGLTGYDNMTDEELREEYELYFESEEN
jgi:hypothetical protein